VDNHCRVVLGPTRKKRLVVAVILKAEMPWHKKQSDNLVEPGTAQKLNEHTIRMN
jgi:hypothetical protein